MTLKISYTAQLELLILDTLLPVYEKYQLALGNKTPLRLIDPKLLNQIVAKKQIAALLKPLQK